jgi:two-component sensor histidine kinase
MEAYPDLPSDWLPICDKVLSTGVSARYEYWSAPTKRWFEAHITRLNAEEMAQLFVDVTERKAAEQRYLDLFDELNHRVKNNLTIVSSLLTLQSRTASARAREELLKAVGRIETIADVHASLYRQRSLETVDLPAYLGTLCERLSQSLLDQDRVRIEVRAAAAQVALDQAVTLGIIVNELVTNAAKHAYAPPASGAVVVHFDAVPEGWRLAVTDEGPGVASQAPRGAAGLGMRLVRSLAEQLGGRLEIHSNGGACFEILLPAPFVRSSAAAEPRQAR